ncbi:MULTISPECIES: gamma subclass chorismate mutase AroQ [unclassified Streptomyces]|uniref:gamma subclass chorismate mutase AroQ n=1 Tax=unclassified Streptomyces TaxID=2593676 RepID=UPI0022525907|nr:MULTISPECIES: gamma subclass chorismate mutase AroQ [unclassified Streptomyces]MCX4552744.1 gamma subclass chorismate mutase AroQ [Streptomyces sp. NBC_01500]WSC24082.1 gamma subclass chorismate mutase AroQ [Streptomyces sp. NBC_01766]WSV57968.1 gamma subclass chorismate mutase AroQ [Streptomyces sp. NBC_01014]
MQLTTPLVAVLTAGAVAAVLSAGAGPAAAAPGPGTPAGTVARLDPVAALSAQRLRTADLVAAAKYGTGSPVDDPARERSVLDAAARQARGLGVDPGATRRIFRDQIEANKDVQRALIRAWDAEPSKAPARRPDLAVVRAEINRVNGALVRAVADASADRAAPFCGAGLALSALHARRTERLDTLHTVALARSLRSVCG